MTYNTRIARCNHLADWAKVVVAGHSANSERIAGAHTALVYTQGALELLQECGPRNIRPDEDRLVDRLLDKAEEALARGDKNKLITDLDSIHADPILAAFSVRLTTYRASVDMACVPQLIEICDLYRDALKISSLIDASDPYSDEIDTTPFETEEEQAQARRLKMMFDDFGC